MSGGSCSNLNESEVKKRKILGYVALLIGLGMGLSHKVVDQPEWMAWMNTVPFFFGFLGLFQAQTKTCVFFATMGKEVTDQGLQTVAPDKSAILRHRSLRLTLQSGLLAVLLSAVLQLL